MAYIGKTPVSGDFVLLDSITTSATASYTMQKNSVNFTPQSANHIILSLNGTIQAPVSSFTVSGSTLTFSEALTSSDVIDFVLVLGNVNDVGTATTVVDSAITKNKLNLISDSSSAGLTVKGDGSSVEGSIVLNCHANTHGIKLTSPDHSAGQSYELIFPTGNVTADKFLKVASVSGSGTTGIGQLSFADADGEDNSPYFFARGSASTQAISSGTMTTVQYNNESLDSDSGYNTSTYKYTIPSGKAGLWFFSAAMYMSSLGDGQQADLYIYKDSVNLAGYRTKPGGSINPFMNIHTISNFAVGDSIYIQVFQNSGSNKDIQPNSDASHFAGFRIKAI